MLLDRPIFDEDHDLYRAASREFFEKDVVPHHDAWEAAGVVPREVWTKAGALGHLCHAVPEEYGGAGIDDFRFPAAFLEEQSMALASGPGFAVHSDIVMHYVLSLGTREQKERWLPKMVTGELIGAVAMTEPGTGSDLAGVSTRAVRDNGTYVINGAKTFITNGQLGDLVIVVARTGDDPHRGISLIMVERGTEGFERGTNLDKIGMKAQDTSELSFTDVAVPVENLVGAEGQGFFHLMANLPRERLVIAVQAVASIRKALELAMDYTKERTAFGQAISRFQNTRFEVAEMATELEVAQTFVDRCITELNAGTLTAEVAAMAKWWTTELQVKVVDRCLQLFGGYGYMMEYPISRLYVDSRVQILLDSVS